MPKLGSNSPIPIKFLIDGGYVSFVYASSSWGINSWITARSKYSASAGALIMMDDRNSLRKDFYPEYKAQRAERAAMDPKKLEVIERVRAFRTEVLEEDPTLRTFKVNGLEADDLVALALAMQVMPPSCRVIGKDKDLLQLPTALMSLENVQGEPEKIKRYALHQAKKIAPLILHPHQILLLLAIMGDKSDNVPRVLPKYGYDLVLDIFDPKQKKPFSLAARRFGEAFLNTLWLTILPFPSTLEPLIKKEELPDYLDETKEYWATGKALRVRGEIQEAIQKVMIPAERGRMRDMATRVMEQGSWGMNVHEGLGTWKKAGDISPNEDSSIEAIPRKKKKISVDEAHFQVAADSVVIEELEARVKRLKKLLEAQLIPITMMIKDKKAEQDKLAELLRGYHKKQSPVDKPRFILRRQNKSLTIHDHDGLKTWALTKDKMRGNLFTLDDTHLPQIIEIIAKQHPDWLILNTKGVMNTFPASDDIPPEYAQISTDYQIAFRWELLVQDHPMSQEVYELPGMEGIEDLLKSLEDLFTGGENGDIIENISKNGDEDSSDEDDW